MNEHSQALLICRHLDQGTERLSYRVLERLAASRAAAVAKVATTPVASEFPAAVAHELPAAVQENEDRIPFWWRFAATAVPVMLLVSGVFVVDTVHQERATAELVEVDSALLTDDVPLVAYADHGFGVYINNTRR